MFTASFEVSAKFTVMFKCSERKQQVEGARNVQRENSRSQCSRLHLSCRHSSHQGKGSHRGGDDNEVYEEDGDYMMVFGDDGAGVDSSDFAIG